MQPVSPTQPTPVLPATFWAQLVARLEHDMPAFYAIIRTNALYLSAISAAIPFITTYALPMFGVAVPLWLTFSGEQLVAITAALTGAGIGAAGVAQTTIQTPSTPPLSGDTPEPTVKELIARIAELEARPTVQQPYIYTVPPSTGEVRTVIAPPVPPAGTVTVTNTDMQP